MASKDVISLFMSFHYSCQSITHVFSTVLIKYTFANVLVCHVTNYVYALDLQVHSLYIQAYIYKCMHTYIQTYIRIYICTYVSVRS